MRLLLAVLLYASASVQGKGVLFSGYNWTVKDSGAAKWGPGPNYFSSSTQNVWVDAEGYLHLRISRTQNKWYCAEVISRDSFGFGRYQWRIRQVSPPGELDANVILGLFTWSDRPEYTHREIDVEVARWAQPHLNTNSQYVVQPYQPAGHLKRFLTPSVANVSHAFDWKADRVDFVSEWTSASGLVHNHTWSFVNASSPTTIVPQPFDENARMNLWLFNSTVGPRSGADVEVVLESFTFTPPASHTTSDITMATTNNTKGQMTTTRIPAATSPHTTGRFVSSGLTSTSSVEATEGMNGTSISQSTSSAGAGVTSASSPRASVTMVTIVEVAILVSVQYLGPVIIMIMGRASKL